MESLKNNIENYLNTIDPKLGLNWYLNAKKEINALSYYYKHNFYKIPFKLGCALVSILSPANKWTNNLNDYYNLLDLHFEGKTNYKFYTYKSNVNKALSLVKDYYTNKEQNLDLLIYSYLNKPTSKKTFNFYQNLNDYSNNNYFTIDRHILSICGFDQILTPLRYEQIKTIYFEVYSSYIVRNNLNISFSQFQACLWVNYVLNKHNIKHY